MPLVAATFLAARRAQVGLGAGIATAEWVLWHPLVSSERRRAHVMVDGGPRRGDDSQVMSESTALDVCMGKNAGASLSVRAANPVAQLTREGDILRGRIPSWKRVLVRTVGVGGSTRVWVIEPGVDENEIRFGEFYVRGRFAIADQSNNPRTVERIWKKTSPEG